MSLCWIRGPKLKVAMTLVRDERLVSVPGEVDLGVGLLLI